MNSIWNWCDIYDMVISVFVLIVVLLILLILLICIKRK